MALGERILELLGEGSFAATYKHAVLLALVDLCTEKIASHPEGLKSVTSREVAEKVIRLYWSHTNPYENGILKQNNTKQASILSAIAEHRQYQPLPRSCSAEQSHRVDPERWSRLVDKVEWKLIEMPLPRLHTIGNRMDPFLYKLKWSQSIKRSEVTPYQMRRLGYEFDNRLCFMPGVPEGLVRLSPILKPLIQRRWVLLVAQFNRLEVSRLENFLFGETRIPLVGTREFFTSLQDNRCFYCDRRLDSRSEVDHFVPWSRYPNNAIENLVIAHNGCNQNKRDYLAGIDHLQVWLERMRFGSKDRIELERYAAENNWDSWPDRTRNVASAIYLGLPDGYSLWKSAREFVPLERYRIQSTFLACQ
jgi:hypothetical protein